VGHFNTLGLKAAVVSSVDPEELVDAIEAARLLRQKPQTLASWRSQRRGPEYIKIGRSVLYRRANICAFLAANIVVPGTP
jgi:hypothetical protein